MGSIVLESDAALALWERNSSQYFGIRQVGGQVVTSRQVNPVLKEAVRFLSPASGGHQEAITTTLIVLPLCRRRSLDDILTQSNFDNFDTIPFDVQTTIKTKMSHLIRGRMPRRTYDKTRKESFDKEERLESRTRPSDNLDSSNLCDLNSDNSRLSGLGTPLTRKRKHSSATAHAHQLIRSIKLVSVTVMLLIS